MKSYEDWLNEHMDPVVKKPGKIPEPESDGRGGFKPENTQRARKVDLITLPASIKGTNCGNCEYIQKNGKALWCRHKEVQMHVTERMCCALWDHPAVKRSWGLKQKQHK